MAKAYTPGLKVSSRTTHLAHRILPIAGDVKASLGDVVDAETVVAETAVADMAVRIFRC